MLNTLQFSSLPCLQSSVFIPSIRWFYSFRYPNLLKWYEAMDKRESYLGIKSDYVSSQFISFYVNFRFFFIDLRVLNSFRTVVPSILSYFLTFLLIILVYPYANSKYLNLDFIATTPTLPSIITYLAPFERDTPCAWASWARIM